MDIRKRKKSKDDETKPDGKASGGSKKITITNWEDESAKEVEIPAEKKKPSKSSKVLVNLDNSKKEEEAREESSENDEWHKISESSFDDSVEISGEGEVPDPDVIEAIESWHQIELDDDPSEDGSEDAGGVDEELAPAEEADTEKDDELADAVAVLDESEEPGEPEEATDVSTEEEESEEEEEAAPEDEPEDEEPDVEPIEEPDDEVAEDTPDDEQVDEPDEEEGEDEPEPEEEVEELVDEELDDEESEDEPEDEPEPKDETEDEPEPEPEPKKQGPITRLEPKPIKVKPKTPEPEPAKPASTDVFVPSDDDTLEGVEVNLNMAEDRQKKRLGKKRASVDSSGIVEVVSKRPGLAPAIESDDAAQEEDGVESEPVAPQPEVKAAKSAKRPLLFKIRYMVYGAVIVIVSMLVMSQSRDVVLNAVGMTTSANISVIDQSSSLPLRNVEVQIEGYSFQTNDQGEVTVSGLPFGEHDVSFVKPGYSIVTESLRASFGSGGSLAMGMTPNGVMTEVVVTDWLSGEPIAGANASSLKNSVYSDSSGKAILSTPNNPLTISVIAEGYAETEIEVEGEDSFTVALVPSAQHYFVADNDGSLDLSRINADGSGEEVVLAGVSAEDESKMRFSLSPDGDFLALVSLRDSSVVNDSGQQVSGLYRVGTSSGETTLLDMSSDIELVGWAGNTLVYVVRAEGEASNSPKQYSLRTIGASSTDPVEIASANFFNEVAVVGEKIYYVPSDAYQQSPTSSLHVSNADGSDKRPITSEAVWSIVRTAPNEIAFGANQEWFSYNTETEALLGSVEPVSEDSLLYAESPNGERLAWVDLRLDGLETLSVVSLVDGQSTESAVANLEGMIGPPRWLSDTHLVVRVAEDGGFADYVFHVGSGAMQKITDSSSVSGIDRWNYYY